MKQFNAFVTAGAGLGAPLNGQRTKGRAFTMAEILLSLTIIGVVAAITLPSLTGNINERTWNTQRKALYARLSQAIPLMDSLNGYGTFTEASGTEGTSSYTAGADNVAETFINAALSKVMKVNAVCSGDIDDLADCGVASSIVNLAGTKVDMPVKLSELNPLNITSPPELAVGTSYSLYDTKAASFVAQGGETVTVFYNPRCRGSLNEVVQANFPNMMCVNFVYDLNGNKGPNTVGKDMGFITAFYPYDVKVVAPYPYIRDLSQKYAQKDAASACTKEDSEYRLANVEEMASMFTNLKLVSDNETLDNRGGNSVYWTSSITTYNNAKRAWYFYFGAGYANVWRSLTEPMSIRCVKR